jgi:hypothetical protein
MGRGRGRGKERGQAQTSALPVLLPGSSNRYPATTHSIRYSMMTLRTSEPRYVALRLARLRRRGYRAALPICSHPMPSWPKLLKPQAKTAPERDKNSECA